MKRWLSLFVLSFSLLFLASCQKRQDKTVENNLLTYLLTCTGGSLQACQSTCAAQYPNVTGENFPAMDACNTTCTNNCSLSSVLLLITNR
ncbi:hypothetical protein P3G55_05830 [Leptospira sp. 96542]|nr:hypothetical protein [Leptospira sp. 96542]